jgi:hypothetical protein
LNVIPLEIYTFLYTLTLKRNEAVEPTYVSCTFKTSLILFVYLGFLDNNSCPLCEFYALRPSRTPCVLKLLTTTAAPFASYVHCGTSQTFYVLELSTTTAAPFTSCVHCGPHKPFMYLSFRDKRSSPVLKDRQLTPSTAHFGPTVQPTLHLTNGQCWLVCCIYRTYFRLSP